METLLHCGINFPSLSIYSPKIHPVREYELRKQENIDFAEKHGIPPIDADRDAENCFAHVRGPGVREKPFSMFWQREVCNCPWSS
jgi:epoxyqueuosine reductase